MNFFITTFLLFLFPFFLSLGNQTYAISDYLNPTNSNKENNNSLKPIKRTKRAPVANKDESEEKRKYVPALLKKPRIGINIFQYNSKGFAGLGLHSKSYDLFLSIRSESDNSQPISKIETTDILTQFNLKAKITQKSFFSYGIGYKTTSGKQQSLQSSGNRTITNEEEIEVEKNYTSSLTKSFSEIFTIIGFQSELDPSLILFMNIVPFSTESMKLRDGSERSKTAILSYIQFGLTYVLSI